MTEVAVIGIDIGKTSFHLVALDATGAIQWKKKVSRAQLMRHMDALPRCLVGMEACCGAHHLARELTALDHDVQLMTPQFVKPFLKSNKNDYLDAEAIAECAWRKDASRQPWLARLLERKPVKIATVRLANKTARIAWAVMARKEVYAAAAA